MRVNVVAAVLAGAVALAACETGGSGYGAAPAHQTQLSQCTRNALIGAGIGAVLGAATAPRGNRGENAALGAAAGGLGTYGVCKYLSAREEARVEEAYYQSLRSNRPVEDAWLSDQGRQRSLRVDAPAPAPGEGECRSVSATVIDPQAGPQHLPPETFCRDANGQWRPR
ncbi:MAG TPA: YMGG-like glycine zipper-containing protein [Caulobacterales bacterium]|nr:YMGG-like glycine zipper-containing protein [Caulobacterales bacterium]